MVYVDVRLTGLRDLKVTELSGRACEQRSHKTTERSGRLKRQKQSGEQKSQKATKHVTGSHEARTERLAEIAITFE